MSEVQQKTLPPPGLTDAERNSAARLADNPLDLFQGKTIGWLEDFFRSQLTATVIRKLVPVYAVGDYRIISKDLTAQTGVYVWSDELGDFLYMNGAAPTQADYADLYAFWGANYWGADVGATFPLGDSRGRGLFFCGTNAAADLGDNDGVAEASRQAKHSPEAGNLTVIGAPGGTFGSSGHTHSGTTGANDIYQLADVGATFGAASNGHVHSFTSGAPSATASPTLGTLGVGGTIGSGMTGDGPAHLYIGSLLVRF